MRELDWAIATMTIERSNRNFSEMGSLIREAFANVQYPGDDEIVPRKPNLDLEADAIRDYLKGKHWSTLTAEAIWRDYKGDPSALLTFMTPKAFQFYWPGFLLICLNEPGAADIIADSVFTKFLPPLNAEPDLLIFREERRSLLTMEQLKVTYGVFLACRELYPGDSALEEAIAVLEGILADG